MTLGEYLASARQKPWAWKSHDCCAFPARWAGVDLPDYSNEAEAEAMLHAAGGMVPLWDDAVAREPGKARPVGLSELLPGDVGVIELPATREETDAETGETFIVIDSVECGAIWTGKRWAFVPKGGGIASVTAPTVLKAWRPLCRRP